MRPGQIFLVKWLDIASPEEPWISNERAVVYPPQQCISVGFFINEDKKVLRIGHAVSQDGDKAIDAIPKGCIVKIRRIL